MSAPTRPEVDRALADRLFKELDEQGITVVPGAISPAQLASMQEAFAVRLKRMRWNNIEGYELTEQFRHMVPDVLTLDQGFVDVALHPTINDVLGRYLGPGYELTEAKGWKSLPTTRDFHGWHGDAWYDQVGANEIHREIKLAIYLTDVKSGAFNYIRGSHRKEHPRGVKNLEVADTPKDQIAELYANAGTVFLFDTSGIHRQGVPILEPRQACFYNYHHPEVRLEQESIDSYRYHPLALNAAFLGDLSREEMRILGFGRKTNYIHAYERKTKSTAFADRLQRVHVANIRMKEFNSRVVGRLKWMLGK
jgi:hypothetical protein